MRFSIHTIDSTIFDNDVVSVTLPTEAGEITVLEHHLALMTIVRPGRITIHERSGREEIVQFETSGFLEIQPAGRGVTLLAA